MIHPDLSLCMREFFAWFSDKLTGKPDLAADARLSLYAGAYVLNDKNAKRTFAGKTLQPKYVIRASSTKVTVSGAGAARTFAVPTDIGATPLTDMLVWLPERADIATDDAAAMKRVMKSWVDGEKWATALGALAPAARAALAVKLDQITTVPPGMPSSDRAAFIEVLRYFFTYRAADGGYYAKGTIAAKGFPDGASAEYLTENLQELKVQQGRIYAQCILPELLWDGDQAKANSSREVVFRFDDQGDKATPRFAPSVLQSVVTTLPAGDPFIDVAFFYAEQGEGLAVPDGARTALSPYAAALLSDAAPLDAAAPSPPPPVDGASAASGAPGEEVHFLGKVSAVGPMTPPLPPNVRVVGTGLYRTFHGPRDQMMLVAARPDVSDFEPSRMVEPTMVQSRAALNLDGAAGMYAKAAVAPDSAGQGVLIGVVDDGIDGPHPAFKDAAGNRRIVAVWDQGAATSQAPKTRAAAANKAQYDGLDYGREYLGAEIDGVFIANAPPWARGHGTHVTGIAAGRAFTTSTGVAWPGGVAPGAKIVSVATTFGFHNIIHGVRYCFQKATELGLPCVVNLSLGAEVHPHDGSDPFCRAIAELVTDSQLAGNASDSRRARIICVAAGNSRTHSTHWFEDIPSGATRQVPLSISDAQGGAASFWAYSDDGDAILVDVKVTAATGGGLLSTVAVPPQPTHAAVSSPPLGANKITVQIQNGPLRPNSRRNIEVSWKKPTPPIAPPPVTSTQWNVEFTNRGRSNVKLHGWTNGSPFVYANPQLQLSHTNGYKTGTPAASEGAITVAAFVSRSSGGAAVGELASFSSPGPILAAAGRRAIDVAAPGDVITSVKVRANSAAPLALLDMSGTSQATPHVTGLVAVMLQKDPSLTRASVLSRFGETAGATTRRAQDRIEDWGLGRIDASKLF
ncbi:MAG: S8 family serine peptidase [Polyangiales bacterium]